MAADAKDIRGFRLPFAIGAAVITILLSAATAAWMSALLKSFHICALALRAPTRMDQTADDSKDFICTARACLRKRKTQVGGRNGHNSYISGFSSTATTSRAHCGLTSGLPTDHNFGRQTRSSLAVTRWILGQFQSLGVVRAHSRPRGSE